MMQMNTVLDDLQDVHKSIKEYMDKHDKDILKCVEKEISTPNDALLQEMLLELSDKLFRVNQVIEYIEKGIVYEGILSKSENGQILIDGNELPVIKEFEVLIEDEYLGKEVWTRAFVSIADEGEQQFLIGVPKNIDVNGIKARFRK